MLVRIEIENLVKRYGSTLAVDDISFVAEEGELTSLVGPSGCGKTTTLRCIAGLERPNEGHISIGDETVTAPAEDIFVPPQDREIGFVFQTFDVWPHLTVFENIAYPLQYREYTDDEIKERVMETLEIAGIETLIDKPATQLSGGQQARVGICRAIVYRPKVLLFDEPLTGLDRNLRKKMRYEIKRIQSELGITSVYVTHSQPEAMTLSNKILLMNTNGKIEQMGSPQEVYNAPQTQFTFDFFGSSEEIEGVVKNSREIETDIGLVRSEHMDTITDAERITLSFRAEVVEIFPGRTNEELEDNRWVGTVQDINFLGEMYELLINVEGKTIRCRKQTLLEGIKPGSIVTVHVPPQNVFVYEQRARA